MSSFPSLSETSLICEEYFQDFVNKHKQEAWVLKSKDYLSSLFNTETDYIVDNSPFTRQKEITESMRSILLDWLMELCSEFYLKRETYYLALSYIDRMVSAVEISRNEFQLVGITALYLACKAEEITIPKIKDFVKSADRVYPASSVIIMEQKIAKTLKWQILPTTAYNWLNYILFEWDGFLLTLFKDYSDYVASLTKDKIKQQDLLNQRLETFKRENTYSYKRFREIVQILDACSLDYKTNRFQNWKITGGLLYLMVNKCFYNSKYELLWWNSLIFGNGNNLTHEETTVIGRETVHLLLERFLCKVFNVVSVEVFAGSVQYLKKFLDLPFCYKLPPVSNTSKNVQVSVR